MEIETRGRKATCKSCDHKFKIQKEDKQEWTLAKRICPSCESLYCDLPPTDKELMILQEEYYASGKDKKIFDKMIHLFYDYAEGKILKSHKKVLTFDGALDHYKQNAVTLFLEYYLENENFKVQDSFGGLLNTKILESCYNKKEHAIAGGMSLDYADEEGHSVEYEDTKKDILQAIEELEEIKLLMIHITGLIFESEVYCKYPQDPLIRLINIDSYLHKGDIYFDSFFRSFGRGGKEITSKTLEIIRKELKKDMNFFSFPKDINVVYEEDDIRDYEHAIKKAWSAWSGKVKYIFSKDAMKKAWFSVIQDYLKTDSLKIYADSFLDEHFSY